MNNMNECGVGRRERKKLATRQALLDAALRLGLEHGVDGVTVEDICEAADVSSRTFFNYFPSKESALAGDGPAHVPAECLRKLTPGSGRAGLQDDIHGLLRHTADEIAGRWEELSARRRLLEHNPVLLPLHLAKFADYEQTLIDAIARRVDADPKHDLYPQLVAATAGAVMRVAMRRWTDSDGDRSLKSHVDEAFELFKQGL